MYPVRLLTQTGEPLIGVSVKAEKSNTGVSTDFNGQFSIVMQAPGTLEFSYVGMEAQKKKVSGATKLDIVLKENTNALDDVVVVGYGTQKKSEPYRCCAECELKPNSTC